MCQSVITTSAGYPLDLTFYQAVKGVTAASHIVKPGGRILLLAACEREGSLDSAIRKPAANDFERLHRLCPELETVGFNGQTSGKFAPQFAEHGYRTVVLPSSSPAHMAMTFEQKLEVWQQLIEPR